MQFLRSGTDRRRRVLTEEVIGSTPAARTSGSAARGPDSDSYNDAAREDRQPRVTDLVPRRYRTITLWMVLGLTFVAALETLYYFMPRFAPLTSDGRVAAFDLAGEGSLAAWFSSTLLTLAAAGSVLVYLIRRHKTDDYRGRYRVWLWAAACWLVMSMDVGGSLHEGFAGLVIHLSGQRLWGTGAVWWVGAYTLALGAVGLRLCLDMRSCRSSTAALLLAGACYATAVTMTLVGRLPLDTLQVVMIEKGCMLVGHLTLVLAVALHARFVIMQANGLLKTATEPTAKKSRRAAKAETTAAAERRHDLGQSSAPLASAMARRSAATEDYEDEYDDAPRKARTRHRVDDEEPLAGRKLSKADRKAMRRDKERQREVDLD